MTVLGLTKQGRSGTVEMLPGTRSDPGLNYFSFLGVEQLVITDQPIAKLPGTDFEADRVQEFEQFRFAHPAREVKVEHPGFNPRSELTRVALR